MSSPTCQWSKYKAQFENVQCVAVTPRQMQQDRPDTNRRDLATVDPPISSLRPDRTQLVSD